MIILYLNFQDLLTFLYLVSCPRSCLQDISLGKEIKRYENCRFNSFDTYKSVYFNVWSVCLSNNSEKWKEATCTCPPFMKNFVCKHTIGMSIRLKYCKPPSETKNAKIGAKRKRGRPLNAKKALLIQ